MAIVLVAISAVARAITDPTSAAIDTTGATLLIGTKTEHASGATGTFSDNKGNTWNALTAQDSGAGGNRVQILWCAPTSVGSGHTVKNTGTVYGTVCLASFSGSDVYDNAENGAQSGSTGALSTGSVTGSGAGTMYFTVFGFDVPSGGVSVTNAFSTPTTVEPSAPERGGSVSYKLSDIAASTVWTTVNLVGAATRIAAFKAATSRKFLLVRP